MSGSNLPTTGPIDDAYVVDPDCRDGKHASCVGGACECWCHRKLGGLLGADVRSAWRLRDAAISALGRSQLRRADYERFERAMAEFDQAMASAARALGAAEAMAAAQAALGRIGLRMVGASTRPVEGGILLEAEVQGTLRPGR
jgi:hypothetical protein